MRITVISVGKIKEKYLKDAIDSYSSQIRKNHELEFIQIPDEKAPENLSEALMMRVKAKEGLGILRYVKDDMYVITLEIEWVLLTSEKFVKRIHQARNMNKNHLCFIIGGSLGLDQQVSKRSDFKLSFSKMTFPHQLMQVILLDQLAQNL